MTGSTPPKMDGRRADSATASTTLVQPIARTLRAFERFVRNEASSSWLLLLATAIALVWANSPWAAGYVGLWGTEFEIRLGDHALVEDLQHWVNDGLMALFFFLVGLEIKRELLIGELRSPRRAALPIVAAVGGMVVPAAIYAFLNAGQPAAAGWGIPMATDIAFALAVLTALGDRIPFALKVFLTALAIVDDLGAVLVIALFYTAEISLPMLLVAAGVLAILALANRFGVQRVSVYALLGAAVWLAMLESGVHATVAGVLVAMTVPARVPIDVPRYVSRTRTRIDEVEETHVAGAPSIGESARQAAIEDIEIASEEAEAPLQQLERRLGGFVAYLVVPIFALANAGVAFSGQAAPQLDRVSIGVFLGLVLGKQLGITLASWLAVRLRLAALPSSATWLQLYGVAWLGGIGFTMSLFVTELAFEEAQLIASAKLGIFAASIAAAALGCALLAALGRRGVAASGRGPAATGGVGALDNAVDPAVTEAP